MGAVRTVAVRLTALFGQYRNETKGATKDTAGLFAQIDKLAKDSPEKFSKLTTGMAAFGAGMLALPALAVKLGMEFDKQMSAVSSVVDGTAQDLGALRKAALDAGKATSFTATEAAKAEEELAKAGIGVRDILGGGLKGALSLAAAGQMDLADAATIAAQAMNLWKLPGSSVSHIADVLASAANKSAADMHGMGDSLRQGGLVAAQFGLSLEDTVGTLSAFADRALIGSDAGTSFKSMLVQLGAPSTKAAALMHELGINAYDAQGKFVGITKFAGILQRQLGGLTQQQRDFALATIFGTDAVRSANILYSLGEDKLQGYIDAVDDSGAAAETARKKTDNLAGDVERLKGSLESLAIESQGGATKGLRFLTQAADSLVGSLAAAPPLVTETGLVLAGISGTALLAFAGFVKVRQAVNEALDALKSMGPTGVKAAKGLEVATKMAGRAALAFAALEVVNTVAAMFRPAAVDADVLAGSLKNLADASGDAAAAAQLTGKDFAQTFKDLKFAWNTNGREVGHGLEELKKGVKFEPGFMANFSGSMQATLDRLTQLDAGLAALAKDGHGKEAAEVFLEIKKQADAVGIPFEELKRMFPEYAAVMDEAAKATSGTGDAMVTTTGKTAGLVESMTEAIDKGRTLKDVFEQLNGAALSLAGAEDGLYASFDAATKAAKENGRTLDVHTASGRANRKALEDIATSTRDVLQAMQDSGAPLSDINTKYQEARNKFIKAAEAMGATKKQAKELADQWLKMPPVVTTEVKTPGLAVALDRVRVLGQNLANLPSSKTIKITTYDKMVTLHPGAANRWGGAYEHAATGLLREASTYSAANPGRYMIAEQATGGEAFVPKNGDYGRSMSILSQAARWYGASVVPGGGMRGSGGAMSGSVDVNVRLNTSGARDKVAALFLEMLRVDAGFRATVKSYVGA